MSQDGELFTIGVEEEFQIVDPQTYALSPPEEDIGPCAPDSVGEAGQYELML